jgi:hypothetical protein
MVPGREFRNDPPEFGVQRHLAVYGMRQKSPRIVVYRHTCLVTGSLYSQNSH